MPPKRTPKSVKNCCDVLWSQLVKARAGGLCERCKTGGRLEAHHAYGRVNHRLRWEPRNGVSMCFRCHLWAETHPIPFTHWFEEHRINDAGFLAIENRKGLVKRTLQDYLELEAWLKAEVEDWQQAA